MKEAIELLAIELLEKALEVFSWCQENADEKWMVDHLALVRTNIDQALAILKQPKDQPSSEFTKKCRAMAEVFLESTDKLTEKKCRAMAEVFLESTDKLTEKKLTALLDSNWNGVGFIMRIFGDLLEGRLAAKEALDLCDRLDTSEASRKGLLTALEEAADDFYYIHRHPEDAHTDSYNFMEKVKQATKQS